MYEAQPTSLSLDTSLPLSKPEVYNLDDIVLEPYSLDSGIGISPLMCGNQQGTPEFSPASVYSHGKNERHFLQNVQSSSSYNSFELSSNNGMGDGNSMNNTVSYIPVETKPQISHQYLVPESSMMANNVTQINDRLTSASKVSPPFYTPNFQTTIMPGPERQQFSLLSPANSYDSSLVFPQINWSPVKAVKVRSIQKEQRRQIPRTGKGIRKKNAKYEIPPDETLENIDELIAQARAIGDIDNVVRLIRNKRLLRNRLAALESRERKKRYIERLEKDNKQLNEDLDMATEELAKALEKANDLEHRLASLKKIVDDAR
ncbi:bZIP transcription factor [Erysiphe neolycopersici]|uniref:BZIP transcription factor n=1 Tax=Erysiphe neolycopersici TaxID=212602 RepID=A0A420I1D9_9PEZI|nr:bZIP transcription factor [Erysiphe neolycopersici]